MQARFASSVVTVCQGSHEEYRGSLLVTLFRIPSTKNGVHSWVECTLSQANLRDRLELKSDKTLRAECFPTRKRQAYS